MDEGERETMVGGREILVEQCNEEERRSTRTRKTVAAETRRE
jgi:hypothetical protein